MSWVNIILLMLLKCQYQCVHYGWWILYWGSGQVVHIKCWLATVPYTSLLAYYCQFVYCLFTCIYLTGLAVALKGVWLLSEDGEEPLC